MTTTEEPWGQPKMYNTILNFLHRNSQTERLQLFLVAPGIGVAFDFRYGPTFLVCLNHDLGGKFHAVTKNLHDASDNKLHGVEIVIVKNDFVQVFMTDVGVCLV